MTQAILVLNCGSSSVKFAVITADHKKTVLSGLAERLGEGAGMITFKEQDKKESQPIDKGNHDKALSLIVDKLDAYPDYDIIAVGHRVVHGGELFSASCVIDDSVIDGITQCIPLAPLHNPAHLAGIHAAQKAYPTLPQVAVFDTAFHQTLPPSSYLYALPYHYYQDYGVRRYGFHGTSYRYIKRALKRHYHGKLPDKVIMAHLGNGASICAMQSGQSVATSMGLTPLDGLVQGSRSGEIDPAIITFLAEATQQSATAITDLLWKQSGLLGLSGQTNDCRELEAKAEAGDAGCQRALSVFIARLQEMIGQYAAVMNGVDALVFTGGIGENSSYIREQTLKKLSYLGFDFDAEVNASCIRGVEGNIATTNSSPIWVMPTDEELMITEDVLLLL